MVAFLQRLLHWLAGSTSRLLILAGILLLSWGVFAPVGTLVWWLNQSRESLGLSKKPPKRLSASEGSASSNPSSIHSSNINCYIVYLPGVGDYSANQLTPGEEWLLNQLIRLHPNCVAISDVFPYSVANQDLSGGRFLAPVWGAIERADGWLENVDVLIKIRNLWRFAISADDRYGPVYSQGIADAMIERMNAVHPIPTNHCQPLNIILIGTSGGVQVALGSLPYLDQWLNTRLTVVSVGGDFNGENGFKTAHHVYHLQGSRDWVEDIPRFVFASRWPATVGSPFNQARRQGRYTVLSSGPHAHDGEEGYFGMAIAQNNTTYVELTLQKIQQLPIWAPPTDVHCFKEGVPESSIQQR
ncbi:MULTISPECIES: hypothetical protein [unclassified Leptolyngbya]|uniref:hypothetical protein n=1 Tax=unclassified Leptolyngbya TaxID=2650499 RepID=UPI00168348A2|nr:MULTISPECIES: hypothetical protein [unclassified Leptolyngbya]MBD1913198.1 hypothetical protein [Leptolyngbya sp. FACHB-8]MBD2154920.1 hypothetical protein [Leptolyngbya sp. FACHB-16]